MSFLHDFQPRPFPPFHFGGNGPKSSPAIAAGDNNDVEMDGGPVKDGDMDLCGQSVLPPEKVKKVKLCQYSDDPFTCIKEPKSTQLTG